ncbi:hypothetical protein JS528_07445 [Bifidobacterium sp. MA2]|uniref:DUF559 domain-containing protein n=2 Tax=Bifidobacterium santillanense TaxID=2809028 RepID=A0ABS5UQL1_9BIFI|nr:hypothetical protein [Bifidobacterium santillanense]
MLVSLDQRRRDAIRRCTDAARSAGTQLLFGMTTSLALQSAPIPDGCDLDPTLLHTVSSDRTKRVRSGATVTHLWRALPQNGNVRVNRNVYALDLFHTWAQLADHLPLESLIVLGDAIITATARQRALARGRDAAGVHRDLLAFAETLPRFKGKRACLSSIQLIRPGADSPPESRERLSLLRHGLPDMALNHTVPDVAFRSGAAMTLDMAWPQWRVAVEYDGDQHRTDKAQWRRDTEKRDLLRGRDWVIFVATGATLADAGARAEFAFRVARVLTMRGAEFMFRVAEAPIETVIREVRRRG